MYLREAGSTQSDKDMEMAQSCILSAECHEQRWVKEMTHKDADVAQRCEASSSQVQAAERFPPTGLLPVTHYFQETLYC